MNFVSDTQAFGSYFQREITRDPYLIRDAMSEELKKRGLPQTMLPEVLRRSAPFLNQIMPDLLSKMPAVAELLRTMMPEKLKGASKSGHIKALNKTLAPEVKVRRYANLNYRLAHSTEASIPLGDSAILFHVKDERPFKPFLEKDDILKAVLLPISPHHVLIGCADHYQPNISDLPREIAACSLEYFIASEGSEANANLSENIGLNAHMLSKPQINAMVSGLMNE